MSKIKISAKILKIKKKKVFIIITQKTNQHTSRVGLFLRTKHETNYEAVQAPESDIGF